MCHSGTINRYFGDFEEESRPAALVGDFKMKCLRFHSEETKSILNEEKQKQNSKQTKNVAQSFRKKRN